MLFHEMVLKVKIFFQWTVLNIFKDFKNKTPNYSAYRYLLLSQLYRNTSTKSYIFYFIFRKLNWSNNMLNKNAFTWWLSNVRLNASLNNTNFYKNVVFGFNNSVTNKSMHNNFLIGLKSAWLSLRFWIVPAYLGCFTFFYLSFLRLVSFNMLAIKCIMLFGFFYWLFSGFTFFLKKYQYRYFTSSLQRFWKRSYAIFWMLEFYTFAIFFYLTSMASQEPFFMYDNAQFFKTHLFSWRFFLLKMFLATVLITVTYFLIIATKWSTISKLDNLMMLITFILLYIVWVEFYQFFHVISYYGNMVWKISEDTSYWYLENEFKKTRINNHFVTICLMAKFWHIIFTLIFWLFFVVRGLEMTRVRYPLLVANFQNFIFVYILAWIYMYPWIKFVFLKLFNTPYYWFYINNKRNILYIFMNDYMFVIKTIMYDLVTAVPNALKSVLGFKDTISYNFFYLHESAIDTSFTQYRKGYIKDYFLKTI